MKNKITLIGAGPGDPELITVKGLKALKNADAILYDALSGNTILKYAKPGSELIYVGKRCGKHSLIQSDINALLLQMCKKHNHVVRLKGGDPFVFGRGHEELVFLESHNIVVDVIPGISSVTSLPLLQKVPLTRRNVSQSFWVLTGTTKNHQLSNDLALAAASSATIVILMGMRKLDEICEIFRIKEKSELPVMIVSNGSTPKEKVVLGTISSIVKKVKEENIGAPGIIIAGKVVALHPQFIHQYTLESWL